MKPVCPVCGKTIEDQEQIAGLTIRTSHGAAHKKCFKIKENWQVKNKADEVIAEIWETQALLYFILGAIIADSHAFLSGLCVVWGIITFGSSIIKKVRSRNP